MKKCTDSVLTHLHTIPLKGCSNTIGLGSNTACREGMGYFFFRVMITFVKKAKNQPCPRGGGSAIRTYGQRSCCKWQFTAVQGLLVSRAGGMSPFVSGWHPPARCKDQQGLTSRGSGVWSLKLSSGADLQTADRAADFWAIAGAADSKHGGWYGSTRYLLCGVASQAMFILLEKFPAHQESFLTNRHPLICLNPLCNFTLI